MIVELPGTGLSASAERRSKTWCKHLTGVDTNSSDGYAFLGTFHRHGDTIEVPDDAWVMSFVEDVRASGRSDGCFVELFQVQDGQLTTVDEWTIPNIRGWALRCRDAIAAYLAPSDDTQQLAAERVALLNRIAEIDALLSGRTP